MALSTYDTEKWFTIKKWKVSSQDETRDRRKSPTDYDGSVRVSQRDDGCSKTANRIRQSQKRVTQEQVARMSQEYRSGTTVYELGKEYGIDRRTVADRLKKAGVTMRYQNKAALKSRKSRSNRSK